MSVDALSSTLRRLRSLAGELAGAPDHAEVTRIVADRLLIEFGFHCVQWWLGSSRAAVQLTVTVGHTLDAAKQEAVEREVRALQREPSLPGAARSMGRESSRAISHLTFEDGTSCDLVAVCAEATFGAVAVLSGTRLSESVLELLELFAREAEHSLTVLTLRDRVTAERDGARRLLMQAPAAIAVLRGPNHVYELSNPTNDRYAGRPVPIGESVREVLPDLAATDLPALLDHVYRTGEPFFGKEVPVELNDGERARRLYLDGTFQPLRDSAGQVEGILAFAYDVTEHVSSRHRAEALARDLERQQRALAESEARARRLQDSGIIGVMIWTRDGAIIDANEAFLQLVGYSRDDLASGKLRWPDLTPPEFRSVDERALRELDSRGVCKPFEKEYLHRDGRRVPVLIACAAWTGTAGEGVAWVLDISERKRLEEQHAATTAELLRRRQELQALLDHAPAAIFMKDLEGRFLLVNRAAAATVGLRPQEVLGKTDHELLDASVADAFRAVDQRVVELGAPIEFEESALVDGTLRTAHTVKFPIFDAAGRIYATAGFSLEITERKQLETALRQQSLLSATITDNATAALFLLDDQQRCSFMNPAAEAMTGYSFEDLRGQRLHDVVHSLRPDGSAYPSAECPIERSLPEKRQQRGEEVFVRKDGSFFPVAFTASPILENGSPVGTVIEVRDITEDKAAEEALTLQARVLQNMGEGVSVSDENGFILFTNAAEDEMFGYARGELIGKHVTIQNAYPAAENAARVADVISELKRLGTWSGEWMNQKKDGSVFFTRARISTLHRGDKAYFVCVQADVTEERRRQHNAMFLDRLGTLLTSSLDLATVLDGVVRLSARERGDWCAVYLRARSGQLELRAFEHLHASRHETLELAQRSAPPALVTSAGLKLVSELETGVVLAPLRAADVHPSYHQLLAQLGTVSLLAVPLRVHGETIGAFVCGVTARHYDHSDLTLAEEVARRVSITIDNIQLFEMSQRERRRAEEASRAKDELLSTASHELRTPLNAILGWSSMLKSGSLSDEKRARALQIIDRNARIQVQLVDDILDVSRVITGKLRLEVAWVDPVHVLTQALEVVRPSADAKGVALELDLDHQVGMLRGDQGRLQQVCWNLLSNAVKFTPRGGHVSVTLRREASDMQIVVADTGQGIDPSFLPHVFEPFRQQDGSSTRVHGGLGLGLAIVKHLVELHGGRVRAESAGAGSGAAFIVSIPIAPLSPSAALPSSRDATVPSDGGNMTYPEALAGLRVLVVDDHADARDLVQSILELCKVRVQTAASAAEAFTMFREHPPDVLISDVGMGEESGHDLIRKIRALPAAQGGRVPAIALTAYASDGDRSRALLEGFTTHVGKPTDPRELVSRIAALAAAREQP